MGYGPAEAFSGQQYLDYYSVNCVGPQRLNQAALLTMRAQGKGLLLWIGSLSSRGGTPALPAPYSAAKAGMDTLAVSYGTEVSRFEIEACVVVPGAFMNGMEHFTNAGKPESKEVEEAYFGAGRTYEGMSKEIPKELAGLEPPEADINVVEEEVVTFPGMELGTRPFRVHLDRSGDGAEAVNKVADAKKI